MKIIAPALICVSLGLVWRATDAVEKRWFDRVDGVFTKGEFIDINADGTDRLYVRYGPISDSGVELERTTNNAVTWRVHVQPLGVAHSKYRHEVHVRIEGEEVRVTSFGAKQIFEVRTLKTGKLISRTVAEVQR